MDGIDDGEELGPDEEMLAGRAATSSLLEFITGLEKALQRSKQHERNQMGPAGEEGLLPEEWLRALDALFAEGFEGMADLLQGAEAVAAGGRGVVGQLLDAMRAVPLGNGAVEDLGRILMGTVQPVGCWAADWLSPRTAPDGTPKGETAPPVQAEPAAPDLFPAVPGLGAATAPEPDAGANLRAALVFVAGSFRQPRGAAASEERHRLTRFPAER
jgi:hypothetical protein